MAEMMPHYCSACGQPHGDTGNSTPPEVEIARIQAQRDIKVAEMQRGEFKRTPEELETEVEVAQIEADAQVGAAEAIGDALAEAETGEPAAVEIEPAEPVELDEPTEEEVTEPEPPEVTSSPTPREPKKATHWGLYR